MRADVGKTFGLKHFTLSIYLLLNLIFSISAPPSQSQNKESDATKHTEKFEKSFEFSPGGKVQVNAFPAGNINVQGWSRASVKIDATKIILGGTVENMAEMMKRINIRTTHDDVEALITASASLPKNSLWQVDYTIHVPAGRMDLTILAANGTVTASGINGWLSINALKGDLKLIDLKGHLTAHTKNGNVHVTLTGSQWEGSQVSASTGYGKVTLEIPKNYSADFFADTKNGKIYAQYPPPVIEEQEIPLTPVVKKKASWLSFKLKGGGASIKVHADLGDIYIVEKK